MKPVADFKTYMSRADPLAPLVEEIERDRIKKERIARVGRLSLAWFMVVSGDLAVMVGTILVPSSDGDMDDYLASLERVRDLDAPLLLPAHGPLSPVPEKLLNRYISHRREVRNVVVCVQLHVVVLDIAVGAEELVIVCEGDTW